MIAPPPRPAFCECCRHAPATRVARFPDGAVFRVCLACAPPVLAGVA